MQFLELREQFKVKRKGAETNSVQKVPCLYEILAGKSKCIMAILFFCCYNGKGTSYTSKCFCILFYREHPVNIQSNWPPIDCELQMNMLHVA